MAFNGSGTFNRLYDWVTDRNNGTKIRADRFDAEMDGMATGLSTAICKDGQTTISADIPFNNKKITGLGDAAAGTDALNRQTGDARFIRMARGTVASGATTDLSTATNGHQIITGTTGITSFGSTADLVRFVTFAGALTITHNATSLILPNGTDILTAAGDAAVFASDGSGNWRCLAYMKADSSVLQQAETTLASATTTDIGAEKSERVAISGTTTITGFGTKTHRRRFLRFTGALTLTHNATSLILPGGANITTVAGDTAIAVSDGSGNWRVIQYTRISDTPDQFDTATQTEMEALTAGYAVTPPNQHYHPGHPKVVCNATVSGGINYDYNVSSITDVGTGIVELTSDITFAAATSMVAFWGYQEAYDHTSGVAVRGWSRTTTTVRGIAELCGNGVNRDPDYWDIMVLGNT